MLDERVDDCLRVFAIKLYQHHVARLTLDQGRDLAVATAKDQVAFPMPRQSCLGQCAVRNEFAALGAPRSAPRSCICLVRQVAVVPTIALHLPADCRWCSSQSCSDGPDRRPHDGSRDLFSLGQRQCGCGPCSLGGTDSTCLGQDSMDRRVGAIKELADLMQSPALLPSLLNQRVLAVRIVDSGSLLHLQHSCRLCGG